MFRGRMIKIRVYSGRGVAEESREQTLSFLKRYAGSNPIVETLSLSALLNENWESDTSLFVMPGGADIPYKFHLDGKGNQKIRSFVENGGSYLGICAGAYFGGGKVEFDKGGALEVLGERELSFFPGTVSGPHLAPYDYKSKSGAKAARLTLASTHKECPVLFFNGGGYFVDAENYPDVKILAWYDHEKKYPAVVFSRIGNGKVILSGVHFEYDPHQLEKNDPHLQLILNDLIKGDALRVAFGKELLSMLSNALL